MLYLPLEFGEITMDGLVDLGVFINAISWSDYNAIKLNNDSCVIKDYPQPPFKIECANAQLEQPIATSDIQFNPKPPQIITDGNQTIPTQQIATVNAIVITTNTKDITGAIQPSPQFDETANIIVAPALASAHNKRINIRIVNLTEFLCTLNTRPKQLNFKYLNLKTPNKYVPSTLPHCHY